MLYYLIPRVCFNGCLQSSTAWSHPPTWQRSPPSSPLSSVCPHLLVWPGSARPFFTGPSCKMRSWRPSWMPVLTTLPPPQVESGLLTLNTADTHIQACSDTRIPLSQSNRLGALNNVSSLGCSSESWRNHSSAWSSHCWPQRGGHEQETISEQTRLITAPHISSQRSSPVVWSEQNLIS